jgi:hypothetical protein
VKITIFLKKYNLFLKLHGFFRSLNIHFCQCISQPTGYTAVTSFLKISEAYLYFTKLVLRNNRACITWNTIALCNQLALLENLASSSHIYNLQKLQLLTVSRDFLREKCHKNLMLLGRTRGRRMWGAKDWVLSNLVLHFLHI